MSAAEVLGLVAVVIGLAVAAEMAGDRIGMPNFLFFILAGLAVGPAGLGLVHHEVFGEDLGVVVGLGVAIIIFHSGSGITREELETAPAALLTLATVGIALTFLGVGAVAYLLMDISIGVALLMGALLVATGTTVIEPLLEAVPVRDKLASTLEIEATVTEVSAGILAITVFNAFRVGDPETAEFVFLFSWVLGVGVVVGLVGGVAARILFKYPGHAPDRAPQHASILYFATAVITYAGAELIAEEAGVAAVAVAGIVIGNTDLPYGDRIEQFEDVVTMFIISFIFVILASFAEPAWLDVLGIEGVIVAIAVIVFVRPLAVFLSTAWSDLSTREKLFISVASPRGIIPAGVASLLALSIQESNPDAAAVITGTVLLVIILSGLTEGVFAGRIARRFGLTVDTTVIVGGGRLGLALASQYAARGERVVLVETDWEALETARTSGFTAYHGDGTEAHVLNRAGVDKASRLVAATNDDEINYEIAQLAIEAFDLETVLVRVNRRDNQAMFDELAAEPLTGSQLELWSLEHLVDQSAPDWLLAMERSGGIRSMAIDADVDVTVADIDEMLPSRAFVLALCRDGDTWIPEENDSVEMYDRLTIVGRSEAIEGAARQLEDRLGDEAIDFESFIDDHE